MNSLEIYPPTELEIIYKNGVFYLEDCTGNRIVVYKGILEDAIKFMSEVSED